ncbi:MAG: division/cell wall cluster transcriptional repressor MraZ, partial [Clostridia bacterium]|nr:division/cell wall cluster transcriptional repressor MraZ [Clostridia bacterium]
MFYGEYKHTVDSKGRLFIPAKFRDKLGDEFILSRGFDKCIRVYPISEWEKFTAKLQELPAAKERHVLRFFYSGADEGSLDAQGRVTLNQAMRNFANLEKEVVIAGGCSH